MGGNMSKRDSLSCAARWRDKLPSPLHLLEELAFNFWWSWSPERLSIFREIDYEKWEQYRHNPVKLLDTVSYDRLTQLANDPYYCDRLVGLQAKFEYYMQQRDTWASQVASQLSVQQPVAYFSIEFGLHPCLRLFPLCTSTTKAGKRSITWIINSRSYFHNRVVFIEDFDMQIAEKLVQGVDVWLNNPLRR
jgi:glucan phosphorylase